jgi:hypothetical protein
MRNMKIKMLFAFLCFISTAFSLSALPETNPYAPVSIVSSYSSFFSAGDKVPVKFTYNYSCPLAYSIDIYEDNNISNSICTKIVNGMGWITTNTYSGIVCEKVSSSNVIEDVCGISANARDGSYTLHVILFDRFNNPAVFDSRVGAIRVLTNKPDLRVSSIEVPEKTFVNEVIPVKVSLVNSGLRDASSFTVALYLNSNSEKKLIEEKSVLELKQGSQKQVDFAFDSSLLFPGNYFLEAVVDSGFNIEEQNENNNLLQKKIELSASSDYPDLAVVSLDYLESVKEGETIPVSVTIKNNGLQGISDSFMVSLLDPKGKAIESKIVYGLNSGEEKTISFFVSSSGFAGKTSLSVSVDKLNLVNEASKKNNYSTFFFSVVSSKKYEECYNDKDDDSDGLIDEGCKTDYSVELKDYLISPSNEKIFPVVRKGKKEFRFDSSQLPSFFVVPFEVNARLGENKDFLEEFNQKNFCVSVSDKRKEKELILVFSGKADKMDRQKNYSFLEFLDSFGSLSSYFWLVNKEQKKLPADYLSSLYAWSLYGKENSGFYFSPELLGFTSPGEFEITLTSNCYGTDVDGDTSNDSKSLTVKIVSREENNGIDDDGDGVIDNGFDLELSDFYFEPTVLFEKETSKAFLKVRNNGKFVSPQVKVYFFAGNLKEENTLFSQVIPSIQPGETKTLSFLFPYSILPDIENKIIAFLDYGNSFAESDETNNRLSSVLFRYSDYVSLKISDAGFDREIVSPGDKVKLKAKIKNNGFVDAQEFFVLVRDTHENKIVNSIKVSNLKAGLKLQNLLQKNTKKIFFGEYITFEDLSTAVIEYDYRVPSDLIGNRSYDVCISFTEEIEEENCKKIFFVVSSKADLRINYFEPSDVSAVKLGNPVLLELEIANKGIAPAKNFSLELYYYDSKNNKKVINSVSGFSLDSGQSDKVFLAVDFSREINGSIFAEIDSLNEIQEDEETNNIVSVNLYSYLAEKCFNNIDDDLDGIIDEECPQSRFFEVNEEEIKNKFVFDVMQKELLPGQMQKITFYHSVFGPLFQQKITVLSPKDKKLELFTGRDGSVSFLVDELGEYRVFSSVKSVVFTDSFRVIPKKESEVPFIFLIADFVFGSPENTPPLMIPVILILSFLCAYYAFSRFIKYCFELWDFLVVKQNYGILLGALIAFIFFFVALASNRLFGLKWFLLFLSLEFILIYSFQFYFRKKIEERKLKRIKKEREELQKQKKREEKKERKKGFVLRI